MNIGRVTHGDDHDRLFKIAMEGGYKAMDELRSQGLVSAIGLGVNEYEVCEQAMDHGHFDCFLLARQIHFVRTRIAANIFTTLC